MNKAQYDPNLPIEIEIRKNVIKQIAKVLEEKYLKKVNVQFVWGKNYGKNYSESLFRNNLLRYGW